MFAAGSYALGTHLLVCAADKRPIAGLISVQANAWLDLQVLAQAVANDETFAEYIHCRLRPAGSTEVACEAAVVRQENLPTLSSPVAQEGRMGAERRASYASADSLAKRLVRLKECDGYTSL